MRLVDADALKEFIGKVRAKYDFFTDEERPRYEAHSKALELLNIYLDDAPTIDAVEVVRGEWIDKGADLDGTWYYQCSECSADVENVKYPHCPYCLARMKGADDE